MPLRPPPPRRGPAPVLAQVKQVADVSDSARAFLCRGRYLHSRYSISLCPFRGSPNRSAVPLVTWQVSGGCREAMDHKRGSAARGPGGQSYAADDRFRGLCQAGQVGVVTGIEGDEEGVWVPADLDR